MSNLKTTIDPKVEAVFMAYPDFVSRKMNHLRELVIETAEETQEISNLDISLKWGEPAFKTNVGSTLRMDWKEKSPDQYGLYFQCTTRLVETFRRRYDKKFQFEGNRAIIFHVDQKIPDLHLKECIKACLRYHRVKHLETLGIL